MTSEIKEALTYDFNYHLFIASTMLPNVTNVSDRQNVREWLRFFKSCATNLQEMRVRNDLMEKLVKNIQQGILKAPFDDSPSNIDLMSLLPFLSEDTEEDDDDGESTKAEGIPKPHARKLPKIFGRSSAASEFLDGQPVPDIGAFCYMAVISKNDN